MSGRFTHQRRWPFDALEEWYGPVYTGGRWRTNAGANNSILAEAFGISRRSLIRWRETGVPDVNADRVAARLGVHPIAIWPDWCDEYAS